MLLSGSAVAPGGCGQQGESTKGPTCTFAWLTLISPPPPPPKPVSDRLALRILTSVPRLRQIFPWAVIESGLFCSPIYWLCNLRKEFWRFMLFWLAAYLLNITSSVVFRMCAMKPTSMGPAAALASMVQVSSVRVGVRGGQCQQAVSVQELLSGGSSGFCEGPPHSNNFFMLTLLRLAPRRVL